MDDLRASLSMATVTDLVEKSIVLPPDGGWGWVVVVASFLSNCVVDGVIWIYGQFLDDISDSFDVEPFTASIASSLITGFYLITGPLACGIVKHFGFQIAGFLGSTIAGFAFLIAASQTSITVFLTVLGVIGGTGLGLIYLPAVVVVGYYFNRWRSLATSIAITGSDVGVMMFSILFMKVLDMCDWRIKFKCITCTLFLCSFLAMSYRTVKPVQVLMKDNVIVKILPNHPRRPSKPIDEITISVSSSSAPEISRCKRFWRSVGRCCKKWPSVLYKGQAHDLQVGFMSNMALKEDPNQKVLPRKFQTMLPVLPELDLHILDDEEKLRICKCCPKGVRHTLLQMLSFKLLKSPSFALIAASNFFAFLGVYIPFLYIVDREKELDIDKNMSYLFYICFGVSSVIGRLLTGLIPSVSSVHPITVFWISTVVCGGASIISYFFVDLYSQYAYFSVFGLTSACLESLRTPIVADLYGIENLANGFGMLMLFQGLASFLGAPIAGLIVKLTKSYNSSMLFTGSVFILSALLLIPVMKVVKWENKRQSTE